MGRARAVWGSTLRPHRRPAWEGVELRVETGEEFLFVLAARADRDEVDGSSRFDGPWSR